MNGDMMLRHEEQHCERLQFEYLGTKGIALNDYDDLHDLNDDDDYWDFVLEDMNG